MLNTETILTRDGVELNVVYSYTREHRETGPFWDYTFGAFASVNLDINGHVIEILSLLHPSDKEFLIDKLTYE